MMIGVSLLIFAVPALGFIAHHPQALRHVSALLLSRAERLEAMPATRDKWRTQLGVAPKGPQVAPIKRSA